MLTDILKKLFGQQSFKSDIHENAVYAILEGEHNVCIRMPPKSGKSICYQLPACMHKGKVSLIISPTLKRIKYHIKSLRSRGINAHYYTTHRGANPGMRIIHHITSNPSKASLVYVSAEVSTGMDFKELVKCLKRRKLISYVVIEEADCISRIGPHSKWYYTGIRRLRYLLGSMPVILMTTIGTKKIMDDVVTYLRLCKPIIYSVPMYCPSVYYDVWYLETLDKPFNHLKEYIVETCGNFDTSMLQGKKHKCIIYCKSKDTTELIANTLSLLAVPTVACHSALKNHMRTTAKKKWLSGEVRVIAVTTDIEADVQKDSIGCVVHWMIPESISKFYLRTSNVNLHIDKIFSRVYFSNKAYTDLTFSENEENTVSAERIRMKKRELITTISFCLLKECRHVFISNYFGEQLSPCKSLCDVCCDPEQIIKRIANFKALIEGNISHESENVFSPMDTTPDMFDDESDQSNNETGQPVNKKFVPKIDFNQIFRNFLNKDERKDEQKSTLISIECDTNKSHDLCQDINLNDDDHNKSQSYIEEPIFSETVKATSKELDLNKKLDEKMEELWDEEEIKCSQMYVSLPNECDANIIQVSSENILLNNKNDLTEALSDDIVRDKSVKATGEQMDMETLHISETGQNMHKRVDTLLSIDYDVKEPSDKTLYRNLNNKNDNESSKDIEGHSLFSCDLKETEQLDPEIEFITEIKTVSQKDQRKGTHIPTICSIEHITKRCFDVSKFFNLRDKDRDKDETHSENFSFSESVNVTKESLDPEIEFITEIKRQPVKDRNKYTELPDSLSVKYDTRKKCNIRKFAIQKDEADNNESNIKKYTSVTETDKYLKKYYAQKDNLTEQLLREENEMHTESNVVLGDDIYVRHLKRKTIKRENKDMGYKIKRKKYNDLQEATTSFGSGPCENTISATQRKLDVAKNLMAKYKLNDNEVSLVPLKRSKSTPQGKR